MFETVMGAVLISLVILAGGSLLRVTGSTLGGGMSTANLNAKVLRVMDRLQAELMEAGRTTLDPEQPEGADGLTYQRPVGYADGAVVWGPPCRFELREVAGERVAVWIRDFEGPDEEVVTLTRGMAEYLEGETANGADDNANGLVDERGLSFHREGDKLVIALTLEETDARGEVVMRTATTAFRLRN